MFGIYGQENGVDIIPGEIGSNAVTQNADNSGNTVWNDGYSLNNPLYDDSGRTVANQTLYSTTADKFNSAGSNSSDGLAGLKQFVNDNKALIGLAGAGSAMLSGSNSGAQKTGYQGSIPELMAGRTMITKPPTRAQGYRPGAGGIDYGGDVSYIRTPGLDPWAYLSGTSGSAAGANLGDTGGITGLKTDTTTTKTDGTFGTGTKTNVVTPGSDAYKKFIAGGGTPQGYLKTINDWLSANPNVTNAQLQAKMRELGISQTDLQTALGASKFSAAEKYALTHGMGSSGVNDSINNWLAKYPNATAQQISDAMKSVGMNTADIQDAFAANPTLSSKADQWNILNNKGTAAVSSSINNYLALNPTATAAQKQVLMDQYGISAKDVQEAEALPLQNKAAAIARNEEIPSASAIATAYQAAEKNDTDPAAIGRMIANSGLSTAQLAADFGLKAADLDYLRGQGYLPPGYAEGGEIAMAKGRYLQGGTDGMADEIPAQIGKNQPAALSHGEFVIPADVVSHMGNGNSDAGAKKLYQMMDKIRMARTGNKKQGKKINPDKFMPGGLAQAYASGGSVKHFEVGGLTTANKNATQGISGIESNLSNWAGPYVTNMLGQGQALANMPYQAYMGPLTAGQSSLQNQGFNAAAGLTTPTSLTSAAQTAGDVASVAKALPAYDSTTFTNQYTSPGAYSPTTSTFDASQATAYMNPYLQTALQPQLEEARRQSQITQQQNAAKMTQAGAFGGSRQAILDAETQRNLGTNLAGITGQGYNTAYGNAMNQFNADQQRKMQEAQFGAQQGMTAAQLGAQYGLAGQQATEQSKQYGAGYGLQGLQTGLQAAQTQGALGTQQSQVGLNNLNALLSAGAQQRGIESEGIAADKAQFEEARANPYKMIQYQQSLLQGLPLAAQSYQGIEPTALVKAAQGATTVNGLLKALGLIE
jgi:hypothetical protein